jgi:hypothetical protein
VQLLRDNADKLFQSTLDAIMNIITEKKALRKSYADERARLDAELARVSMNIFIIIVIY